MNDLDPLQICDCRTCDNDRLWFRLADGSSFQLSAFQVKTVRTLAEQGPMRTARLHGVRPRVAESPTRSERAVMSRMLRSLESRGLLIHTGLEWRITPRGEAFAAFIAGRDRRISEAREKRAAGKVSAYHDAANALTFPKREDVA